MLETYREFNEKTYMIDEFTYFGLEKSDAEKRKDMWKQNGHKARCIKNAIGKYVIYREYPLK